MAPLPMYTSIPNNYVQNPLLLQSTPIKHTLGFCFRDASSCQRLFRCSLVFIVCVISIFFYLTSNKLDLLFAGDDPFMRCSCHELHVDPAASRAQAELSLPEPISGLTSWESLARHHPNLPLQLLNSTEPRCSLMPDIFRISWTGVHWQIFQGPTGETFLLYSAFFDNRTKTDPPGGTVRLLVLISNIKSLYSPSLPWCHFWYEGLLQPVPSRVLRAEYIDWQWRSADRLQSFVLTCAAPSPSDGRGVAQVPVAVSLVAEPCQPATNLLRVVGLPSSQLPLGLVDSKHHDNTSSSWRVGVCGPALFYFQEDFSIRLVEWLELLRALGVSQVFLYTTRGVHPNINKVLRHYEKQGFVELMDFYYPPPYMDEPLLRRLWTLTERRRIFSMENIYFSDCILRYKDRYRFLAHFDPDEVPVLLQHDSLPELVANLTKITADWPEPPPSYKLFWQYFLDDVIDTDDLTINAEEAQPFPEVSVARSLDGSNTPLTPPTLPSTRQHHAQEYSQIQDSTSPHHASGTLTAGGLTSSRVSETIVSSLNSSLDYSGAGSVTESTEPFSAGGAVVLETHESVPSFLHIMRHSRKLRYDDKETHQNFKSIYDTQECTGVISHKVIICAGGPCDQSHELSHDVAFTGHFNSETCGDLCRDDTEATVYVPRLRRNHAAVLPTVMAVLRRLDLLP